MSESTAMRKFVEALRSLRLSPAPLPRWRREMQAGKSDCYQSQPESLEPLLPHLAKFDKPVIWESACGMGFLRDELRAKGYRVVATDIGHKCSRLRKDFFQWEPQRWDVMVTNPPYSRKTEWIRRAFELKRPWALLVPIYVLEFSERQSLFDEYGVQLILPAKRYSYLAPSGKWLNRPRDHSLWLTHGLDLPKDLTFYPSKSGSHWTASLNKWFQNMKPEDIEAYGRMYRRGIARQESLH